MTANSKPVQRKLAAVLAADIARYSALMGQDDVGTVQALKGHQAAILPLITTHEGRLIDTAGDGVLAEFASAVKAVECALAIQTVMAERNQSTPTDRRLQFRIGVNLGDVLHDGEKLFGNGVNVAARLEGIAEPGTICISAKVKDEIARHLQVNFVDLGPQTLKNIGEPVVAYRIECGQPTIAIKSKPSLPDRPSIAVLPFANLSNDPEQEYFSDGVTEDIITELSRFSELFVIARNSSFTYRGRAVDVRQVGKELGVRYVLEGSIRKSGSRVRITAQLVEASTGTHKWANKYDRQLEDIFAVQDEVARDIAEVLVAHIDKAEIDRVAQKPPSSWVIYDKFIRSQQVMSKFNQTYDRASLFEARRLLTEVISQDPHFARAYASLSATYSVTYTNPVDDDYGKPAALELNHDYARTAVSLDPTSAECRAQLAFALAWCRENDRACDEGEIARALNPHSANWRIGAVFSLAGRSEEAIALVKESMRRDPFHSPMAVGWIAYSLYNLKRYKEAKKYALDWVFRSPNQRGARALLAAVHVRLNEKSEAQETVAQILAKHPGFAISQTSPFYSAFKFSETAAHYTEGLRMAGLPE